MNFTRAIFCLLLLILCAGCGSATPQVSTIPVLPTAEPTVTKTLRPTTASTSVQQTATEVVPTPTDAPFSEPVQITPVSEPINQTGPWLMLHPDNLYTGPPRIISPVFVNPDGSGWEPANLHRDPQAPPNELVWWFGSVSPNSPYAAFQGYLTEYEGECNPKNIYWDFRGHTLHILKLPENRIVREFLLIGDAAGDQIDQYPCENGNDGDAPVLGVVVSPYSMVWSPDGRYLAFPAAPDGPNADLYLYDTITNEVRRLTTRQNNPDILGWSPDGQTVIYRSITKMMLYKYQYLESDGLYAVSVSGKDRLLFEPEVSPRGLEWLSKSQFLITDGPCELMISWVCSTSLRLVDISTGKHELLYNNQKASVFYTTDPINHVILINNPPSDMPGLAGMEGIPYSDTPDMAYIPGVFHFDLSTHLLRPVLSGETYDFVWDPTLEAFRSHRMDTDPPYTLHRILIRFIPGEGFSVEKEDDPPSVSPDGNWSVRKVGGDCFFFDDQNQPIQKLLGNSRCGWLSNAWSPDSSMYIDLTLDDARTMNQLIVYKKENGWQPEVVREIKYAMEWSFRWIVP